jgi:hypothetical protein
MYVRRALRAADPADSHVQARTAPENRRQKHLWRRVPFRRKPPREHRPAGSSRTPGMFSTQPA